MITRNQQQLPIRIMTCHLIQNYDCFQTFRLKLFIEHFYLYFF